MKERNVSSLIEEYETGEEDIVFEGNRKKLRIERIKEEMKEMGYVPGHSKVDIDSLGNKSPEVILEEAEKELEEYESQKEKRIEENLNVLIQSLQELHIELKKEIMDLKKSILQNEIDLEESKTSRDSSPEKVSELMKKSEELEKILEEKTEELERCRLEIDKRFDEREKNKRVHSIVEQFHEFSEESEATQPTETQPPKTQTTVTQPTNTQPPKTQTTVAQPTRPQPTKPKKKDEINYVRITICPIANSIVLEGINGKDSLYIFQDLNYTEEFKESEEVKNIIKKVQEKFDVDSLENIDDLDPNILLMLDKAGCEKYLIDYVMKMQQTSETIPFHWDLTYDLKDMYKSEMLYNKEKKEINKLAKVSERKGASVSRDGFFKRMFDRTKSLVNKNTRKRLVEENKVASLADKNEEIISKKNKYFKYLKEKAARTEGVGYAPPGVRSNEAGENFKKMDQTAKEVNSTNRNQGNKKHYINKGVNKARSLAQRAGQGLTIAGIKIKGRLRGDSEYKINTAVRNARNSFVPKANVDHKKANQNSKQNSSQTQTKTQTTR